MPFCFHSFSDFGLESGLVFLTVLECCLFFTRVTPNPLMSSRDRHRDGGIFLSLLFLDTQDTPSFFLHRWRSYAISSLRFLLFLESGVCFTLVGLFGFLV
ncbi:hypothetical protein BDW42DRAFT_56099 [Aspergillus taichungensis]|uniref:Uncharacterized protein n=1 Tax=Aspergillus taichungensis TaxID=482145 RepID=A0A2J5IA06_9EURO|nr:hypothetical protein BDW42DRAFT_56099 [Aspergillus taichungensis]